MRRVGEVSKECGQQRPSVRCGEPASWVRGQTDPPGLSSQGAMGVGREATSADVWGNVPMGKAFQKEAGVGVTAFCSGWEAGPIPKTGEFHEQLKTNPRLLYK